MMTFRGRLRSMQRKKPLKHQRLGSIAAPDEPPPAISLPRLAFLEKPLEDEQ